MVFKKKVIYLFFIFENDCLFLPFIIFEIDVIPTPQIIDASLIELYTYSFLSSITITFFSNAFILAFTFLTEHLLSNLFNTLLLNDHLKPKALFVLLIQH